MTEEKGTATLESIPSSYGLAFASAISVLFISFSWILFHPSSL
jgi:hypothetical protein